MGLSPKTSFAQVQPQQVDSLLDFTRETGADAMLLLYRGERVAGFSNPDCKKRMNTASMVKSWTSLVIGRLVEAGLLRVDDKVCSYLPEWEAGCAADVKIAQLLTMSAGLAKRPAPESVLAQEDMNSFVLSTELDYTPGTRWSYSNESVQLLGLVMERVTQQSVQEVFREYLFDPLGMDSTTLVTDEAGNYVVYGGALTTVEDAAQIGRLMLNEGELNGQRLLSREWIQQSVTPSANSKNYGYLWWIDQARNNYAAMGDFGQMTIVFPQRDLIYLRKQACNNDDPSRNLYFMGPPFLELIRSTVAVQD